jgi:ArsR family transcriptional regulator
MNIMINKKYRELAQVFQALGHPARLVMAKGLAENECQVGKIVKGLKLPQSTVSQHLKILKAAGIVKGERKGVSICYRVTDKLVRRILSEI